MTWRKDGRLRKVYGRKKAIKRQGLWKDGRWKGWYMDKRKSQRGWDFSKTDDQMTDGIWEEGKMAGWGQV
jgi:hypothetical protein